MNKKIIGLFLFFLIAAISLSPRLSLGLISGRRTIDIRAEDILLMVGLLVWLWDTVVSRKYTFVLPPLFWPITAILLFGTLSILINLLLGTISLEITFFYFLKEVEFYLFYFVFFYGISKAGEALTLIKTWILFSLVNIAWLVYVFIFHVSWSISYGPNTFMEPQGPFPSGGYFLMLFIFLFNIFLFYYYKAQAGTGKKVIFFILSVLPIVGVVSSGSMACTLGLIVSLLVSLGLFWLTKKNLSQSIKIILLGVVLVGVFFTILSVTSVWKIISIKKIAFEYYSGSQESRLGILENHFKEIPKSFHALLVGDGVLGEAHSQYMRILLERGLLGLALFAWLMISLLKISYKGFKNSSSDFAKSLSAGLFVTTVSMLFMAIPNDVFMVVKVDETYWFFAAMAIVIIKKYEHVS